MEGLDVFEQQGYGKRIGFGTRPALLIIDCMNSFKDPALFGSPEMVEAMAKASKLLAAARDAKIPVAHTRHLFAKDGSDLGMFARKLPSQAMLTEDDPSSQIADEVAPRPSEIVVRKRYPSGFFSTDLADLFHLRGVDTVLVAGASTSGCVHASVVDAMCHGFRVIIVRECVADRHKMCHEAALLNMDMKYGDVVPLADAVRYLGGIAAALPVKRREMSTST
jgi:maleamate amidohydrolase